MLIKVFGIWLMANNINHIVPSRSLQECDIYMNATSANVTRYNIDKSCDEVAAEINKQIKASKE